MITENGASLNTEEHGWIGSVNNFVGGYGYWVIVDEDLSFSYEFDEVVARSKLQDVEIESLPMDNQFKVPQSSQQAFYFIDDVELHDGMIEHGDWLLPYKNESITGIREWKGEIVDVPAMGYDGNDFTLGYCEYGDI